MDMMVFERRAATTAKTTEAAAMHPAHGNVGPWLNQQLAQALKEISGNITTCKIVLWLKPANGQAVRIVI
jgi:hypothetical protein